MVMLDENLRPRLGDAAVRALVESELATLLAQLNAALTPTMKIKRSRIEANVAGAVATWYKAPGLVVWA